VRCYIKRAKFWNILRIKDFSLFVGSQTVSQFGDKLDYIALIGIIGLFPEDRTPFLLSQLLIFITLPVLIFGPIAGVLVDRWHKKTVMVVCDALRMVCAFDSYYVYYLEKYLRSFYDCIFHVSLDTLF
jgi:hypothetical membrane protein